MTDEFIAKTETRHESPLLEPEYGAGECNHLFGKTCIGGVAPFESPIGFALNAWYCFDGMEQVQFLRWILDVCVDKEGVHFAVDIFDCNLEAIEASGFGCHDFGGKIAGHIFIGNAIGGSKECNHS